MKNSSEKVRIGYAADQKLLASPLSGDESFEELHDMLHKGRGAMRLMRARGRSKEVPDLWILLWGDSLRLAIVEATQTLKELEKLGYLSKTLDPGPQPSESKC